MTTLLSAYDLSYNNTMALTCCASHAIILDNPATISTDVLFALDTAKQHKLPLFVLSFGSNVILPSTLNALVLLPRIQGLTLLDDNDNGVCVQVACGEDWHTFVQTCLNHGWYGLENLALIPGLVGASPVQNIGAYGVQVSDFIKKVIAFDLHTGKQVEFDNTDCQFDYRHSIFKQHPNRYLISSVVFELHKNPKQINAQYGDLAQVASNIAQQSHRTTPNAHDVFQAVIQIRQAKLPDPAVLPNTGSFFQNPIIAIEQFNELKQIFQDLPSYFVDDKSVKIPAGWLIDKAGLKGGGIAPILTHKHQALVLTNHAPHQASQDDILASQNLITQTVFDKFGIRLVREPVWVT